jgi:site-specific DNA-adenine methylase
MNPFLKYPGGKRLLAERILDLLGVGDAPSVLYEPFLGAGAVSLAALGRWPNVQVWGSDAAKPLTDTRWTGPSKTTRRMLDRPWASLA